MRKRDLYQECNIFACKKRVKDYLNNDLEIDMTIEGQVLINVVQLEGELFEKEFKQAEKIIRTELKTALKSTEKINLKMINNKLCILLKVR